MSENVQLRVEKTLYIKMENGSVAMLMDNGTDAFIRYKTAKCEKWLHANVLELRANSMVVSGFEDGIRHIILYKNLLEVSDRCPL